MSRIDTHHHVVPPAHAKLLTDRGLTPGGVDVPEWSPELGLKLMKKADVSTAILSLSTPGVWFGDAKETRWWAHRNAQALFSRLAGVTAPAPPKGFWRKHR